MILENLVLWIVSVGSLFQVWEINIDTIMTQKTEKFYALNELLQVKHIQTPDNVKSIYYTAWALNYWPKRENLLDLLENTEINSVTIDIKTISGYINFEMPETHFWEIKPQTNHHIKDIKSEIELLHEKWIYVIGRMAIFKDNLLTKKRPDLAIKWSDKKNVWTDYSWNSYTDPSSKEIMDYHIALAKTAYELWFDEINFDYIRFPTDGYISDTYYPFSDEVNKQDDRYAKIKVIDTFWEYINKNVKEYNPKIILSADIFWLVTNTNLYQIGQNLESFLLNFDYVGPMIYPSHYWAWFLGYTQPDNQPYEIFEYALTASNQRIDNLNAEINLAKLEDRNISIQWIFDAKKSNIIEIEEIKYTKIRPWLQWFSCGWCSWATPYNRTKFRKQIQAIEDNGMNSWFVWSAWSNYYSERYNK